MPSHGLRDVNILEQEVDFTITTSGTRELEWNPEVDENENELESVYLARNETGSTRLIFEMPRVINNHDMLRCDHVLIHYTNSVSSTAQSQDIYEVEDLQSTNPNCQWFVEIDGEQIPYDEEQHAGYNKIPTPAVEGEKLRFSWIVGSTATVYVGKVNFTVHFICMDQNNPDKVLYDWRTGIGNQISIFDDIDNDIEVNEAVKELVLKWRDQLMFTPEWAQNEDNPDDMSILILKREWDGTSFASESLRGPKGETPEIEIGSVEVEGIDNQKPGVTVEYDVIDDIKDLTKPKFNFVLPSSANCVKTIDGSGSDYDSLYFFVGTTEEYNALDPEITADKKILAIKTDDESQDNILQDIADLQETKYEKPEAGIPETDLSEDVKTKLNAHTNILDLTDRVITLEETKYEKPEAGIPETDLTAETQEKLVVASDLGDRITTLENSRVYLYEHKVSFAGTFDITLGTSTKYEYTDATVNIDITYLSTYSTAPTTWSTFLSYTTFLKDKTTARPSSAFGYVTLFNNYGVIQTYCPIVDVYFYNETELRVKFIVEYDTTGPYLAEATLSTLNGNNPTIESHTVETFIL